MSFFFAPTGTDFAYDLNLRAIMYRVLTTSIGAACARGAAAPPPRERAPQADVAKRNTKLTNLQPDCFFFVTGFGGEPTTPAFVLF